MLIFLFLYFSIFSNSWKRTRSYITELDSFFELKYHKISMKNLKNWILCIDHSHNFPCWKRITENDYTSYKEKRHKIYREKSELFMQFQTLKNGTLQKFHKFAAKCITIKSDYEIPHHGSFWTVYKISHLRKGFFTKTNHFKHTLHKISLHKIGTLHKIKYS